jgi:hypothetical protein
MISVKRVAQTYLSRRAGILEPPPAMVAEISQWVLAVWAAELHRQRSPFDRFYDPAVRPMQNGPVAREFPIDLTGWRYKMDVADGRVKEEARMQDLVELMTQKLKEARGDPAAVKNIKGLLDLLKNARKKIPEAWSSITVTVVPNKASGEWNRMTRTVVIPFNYPRMRQPGEVRDMVAHELQHLAQTLIEYIQGVSNAGLPPRKIRTPDYTYAPEKVDALLKALRSQGITGVNETSLHHLSDFEFFTVLLNAVSTFKRMLKKLPAGVALNDAVRFVTDQPVSDDLADALRKAGFARFVFFQDLKKGAPGKYRRAVNELLKAVS